MSQNNGPAAVRKRTPQSADELIRVTKARAAAAAASLASACRDPEASPEHIVRSIDAVLAAAGQLRGFVFLPPE